MMGKKKSKGMKGLLSGGRLELIAAGFVGIVAGALVMVMPIDVLQDLVIDSGLPSVLPQAEPPLGFKAQALLAVVAAAIGFVVVFGVMKLVDKAAFLFEESDEDAEDKLAEEAPRVRRRDQHPDAPARAPISASREFGEAGEPAEEAPRRGLFAELRPQASAEAAEDKPAERLRRFRPADEAAPKAAPPSFADLLRAEIAEDEAEPRFDPDASIEIEAPVAEAEDVLELNDPLEALGLADVMREPEADVQPIEAPAPVPVAVTEGHTKVTPARAAPRWMDVEPEPAPEPVAEVEAPAPEPAPAPVVAEPVAAAPVATPAPAEPEPVFAPQSDGETIADLIGRLERAVAIRMPGAAPVQSARAIEPPARIDEADEAPIDARLRSALANLKRFAPQG